jgi:hypothetical protein
VSLIENIWDPAEFDWTMHRPGPRRVPLPAAGDRVLYRHRHFADVTPASVLEVQPVPVDDAEYESRTVCGPTGLPVVDGAGRRVMARVPDPWVTLRLATDWGHVDTREARLRGSAGWLPALGESRQYPAIVDGRFTLRRQMEMAR